MLADELDDAVDERLSLEIAQLAQGEAAAEMLVAVRVTARAAQRTLARDLDRERRRVAGENSTPGLHNPVHRTSCSPRPKRAGMITGGGRDRVRMERSPGIVYLDTAYDRAAPVEDRGLGRVCHPGHPEEQADHPLRGREDHAQGEPRARAEVPREGPDLVLHAEQPLGHRRGRRRQRRAVHQSLLQAQLLSKSRTA